VHHGDMPCPSLLLHCNACNRAPGPDIHGDIKLVVGEDLFAVSVPTSLKSPLPLSTRAEAIPDALIDAMKAGSTILVQGSRREFSNDILAGLTPALNAARTAFTCPRV
jgi:hypothetical protein